MNQDLLTIKFAKVIKISDVMFKLVVVITIYLLGGCYRHLSIIFDFQ